MKCEVEFRMGSYQSWCLTHDEKASTEKGCCLSGALERVAELELSAANGTEIMWQNAKLTKRVAELESTVSGLESDNGDLSDKLAQSEALRLEAEQAAQAATLTPRKCGDCNPLKTDVKVVYCREFKPQNQAALHDQLNELIELANMNGLYDAADFVAERRK